MRHDLTVNDIINKFNKLQSSRNTWENTWQDIIDFCMFAHDSVVSTNIAGEVRHYNIYDSTANESLLHLASALNSMLTNQSTEWFQLTTNDDELNENEDVKKWLTKVTKEVRKSIDNSNFYNEAHQMYIDIGGIGTGVLYISESEDPDKDLYFSTRHIKEIFISENSEGEIDTVYRQFKYTAKQMYDRWGDIVSDGVKTAYEKNPEEEFVILHCVYPRYERDVTKNDPENMKYASKWIEYENLNVLHEGGYKEFPYVIPRWSKTTGEKYGRSPALNSLPNIKTLNAMVETLLKTSQKICDPPLNVPDENIEVDLTPGGINYYDPGTEGIIRPIDIGANLPITDAIVEKMRNQVRNAFFTNQLQLIEKRDMTAEEVRIRTDENLRVLGPTFGRLQVEYMDKLISRIYSILEDLIDENGKKRIPEAPDVLKGKRIHLKYLSPLARAQRYDEFKSINQSIAIAFQWGQAVPEIFDNIDFDKAFKILAELDGTPNEIFNSDRVIKQIRKNRSQQQAQAMQLAQQEKVSDIQRKQADAQKKSAVAAQKQAA